MSVKWKKKQLLPPAFLSNVTKSTLLEVCVTVKKAIERQPCLQTDVHYQRSCLLLCCQQQYSLCKEGTHARGLIRLNEWRDDSRMEVVWVCLGVWQKAAMKENKSVCKTRIMYSPQPYQQKENKRLLYMPTCIGIFHTYKSEY